MKRYEYRFKMINIVYIKIKFVLNTKYKSTSMKYIIVNQ